MLHMITSHDFNYMLGSYTKMSLNSHNFLFITGINPMDNLSAQELRKELINRGQTVGKKKKELSQQFNELIDKGLMMCLLYFNQCQ